MFAFHYFFSSLQLTHHSVNWNLVKSVHGWDVVTRLHKPLLVRSVGHSGVGNINIVKPNVLVLLHFSKLLQPAWLCSMLSTTTASVSDFSSLISSLYSHFNTHNSNVVVVDFFLIYSFQQSTTKTTNTTNLMHARVSIRSISNVNKLNTTIETWIHGSKLLQQSVKIYWQLFVIV